MDGLDAGRCAQSEGELDGGHCSCHLLRLSGGIFFWIVTSIEQEELVLGDNLGLSGGFLTTEEGIRLMVKLASNLTVVWVLVLEYTIGDIMSTAQGTE
jgi:hypothetical protein